MRISRRGSQDTSAVEPAGTAGTPAAAAPVTQEKPVVLASDTLAPALQVINDMPDMDMERIGDIRQAMLDGSINFDASKLAELIQRYHRR